MLRSKQTEYIGITPIAYIVVCSPVDYFDRQFPIGNLKWACGKPMLCFNNVVEIQKASGLQLVKGTDSAKQVNKFVT